MLIMFHTAEFDCFWETKRITSTQNNESCENLELIVIFVSFTFHLQVTKMSISKLVPKSKQLI